MAKTETKTEAEGGWDPSGPCPACRQLVHVYVPPDRSLGGPLAYPALLLHYEQTHDRIVPPPAPLVDEVALNDATGLMAKTGKKIPETWEIAPPAAEDWRPLDKDLLKKQQPQPAGVWPPLRTIKTQPE